MKIRETCDLDSFKLFQYFKCQDRLSSSYRLQILFCHRLNYPRHEYGLVWDSSNEVPHSKSFFFFCSKLLG